ncbi:MAG: glycoside hydrolase family 3 protein [Oscillospiraceae bacterium]
METTDLRKAPFFLSDEQAAWVASTHAGLATEEKVGQLFCVMGGDYAPETLRRMVAAGKVGGVLFRPVKTGEEIKADFAPLDAAAKVPLLKAANLEEGGSGGMSDGTLFGWPMLTAATDDPDMAERFGRVCGTEGASIGINWTFSPVCDLDMNYRNPITNVRTFGSDPDRVKVMTARYMEAVQRCGVAACAKHFPGDGVDYRDQHLHPTYNTLSAKEWYASYGAVYENLIAKGLLSVMVGHIGQPNVARDADPSLSFEETMLPASLSRTLLTEVLRDRLGFNGVITSDATIMGGYCMAMERRRAIPASIMAGCDMLVFNTDFEEDYRYMLEALADGRLTMERLDEAVGRILALKAKVCRSVPDNEPVPSRQWHAEAADKAITLVKNTQSDKLPMTPERYPHLRLITLGRDAIPDGSVREIARDYLEKQGFRVELYEPFAHELHGTASLPADRLTLYLANYEQASNQTVVRVNWCPKHALDMPRFVNEEVSVFVSLANPYHLQDVPRVHTYINAYTATGTTIELTIDKLMGRSAFTGVSPVDAFCGLPDTRL